MDSSIEELLHLRDIVADTVAEEVKRGVLKQSDALLFIGMRSLVSCIQMGKKAGEAVDRFMNEDDPMILILDVFQDMVAISERTRKEGERISQFLEEIGAPQALYGAAVVELASSSDLVSAAVDEIMKRKIPPAEDI